MSALLDQLQSITDSAFAESAAALGGVVLAFSAVFALLNCFFGFRLQKLWITLVGFLVGFLLGMIPCLLWISSEHALAIATVVGVVVGVLIGLLAYRLYRVGVFLWVGVLAFGFVANLFPENLAWLGIVLGILAGVLVGILALRFLRPVVILTTALSGGMTAAQDLLRMFDVTQVLVVLGVGALLAVLGMAVQFATTKKYS